ncbi:MAG: VCBS repeat-containing protein, partial [Bacteroidota bacterium]
MIDTRQSGLDFNNVIPEDPTINILNFEYLYNGGGVGIADFNKDGQLDVYFTGNMVDNRLFLNQTDFAFEDVTEISGTAASKKWSNGVSIVDINGDTWPDIYVCVSALSLAVQPKNLLFINQGNNVDGIPTFTEEAEKYGLASTKHSRHAAFFDYDLDGDLDVYVLNNIIDLTDPTAYRRKITNGRATNNDQLYQNVGNNEYKEVSDAAGIRFEGYGLGVAIGDVNQDNWPDIYVANDYISNDLLYINQQDGTFKNEIADRTKLQSKFSMGVTLSDFNNDGASDILVLDMLSATNDRLKRHVKESNYNNRKNNQYYRYQEQVPRNTLQLNDGQGQFGEIGLHAGIYASDWSWSPLTADFNNDGLLDVYVTNGFPKDITELDFVDYRSG